MNTENTEINNDKRFDYPEGVKRVTAGAGGEAILITGSEKTALIDCGMAYCGAALAQNIKKELRDRPLDYVILSHTHYDHIGGLPYLRRAWPDSVTVGARYARTVFESPGALKTIRELSLGAARAFRTAGNNPEFNLKPEDIRVDYRDEDIRIDREAAEGDIIDLGNQSLRVMETPGHTNCSLSFFLEERGIFFPAETMGCFTPQGDVILVMLKGYHDTVRSIEKGRRLNSALIISPHYGQIPAEHAPFYWERARETADNCRRFILERYRAGASEADILEDYRKEFWRSVSYNQQPLEAFEINARHIIHAMITETDEA